MLPVNLEDLRAEHVLRLIAERVREQRTLDYKEALPGAADSEKKEFLADVVSLANAGGGNLVFGVKERRENGAKTGEPETVTGIAGPADEVVRRLEEVARSGAAPRIPGLQFQWVDGLPDGRAVLVVRVPRSWAGPHMVSFKGSSRFFSRNSTGKYQLDVQEIRSAFLLAADAEHSLRAFRDDRLGRVLAGETPVPIDPGAKLVVHILAPRHGFGPPTLDLRDADSAKLKPLVANGWNSYHCHEGFVTYTGETTAPGHSYTLLFRSGAVEAVVSVRWRQDSILYPTAVEEEIVEAVTNYLPTLWHHGLTPPVVVSAALVGARGMHGPPPFWRKDRQPPEINQDVLVFPDVLVEERLVKAPSLLRPMFDAISQTLGLPASPSYGDDGTWNPRGVEWR